MMKSPELSVIIPMYNSTEIVKNMKWVFDKLGSVGVSWEVILVDDGSTNSAFAEALKIKRKGFVVKGYKRNQGKGNAIKYGFNFVKGKYVAFVDSGRDIDPAQLKSFLEIMKRNDADVVIGSKRHPESNVHYPLMRRLMSRVYQTINHFLFNLNVQDTQVGIKLFRRSVLQRIMPRIAIKRFAFDLELLVLASKDGAKIIEAPVEIRYKFGSTVNPKAVFLILWDTAAIFYRAKILRYYERR